MYEVLTTHIPDPLLSTGNHHIIYAHSPGREMPTGPWFYRAVNLQLREGKWRALGHTAPTPVRLLSECS